MKTLGLIGGMSYESTLVYYRLINEGVKARLGGHHSSKLILYSVDFAEIEQLQKTDRWNEAGRMLADAAIALEKAGAEILVLCTNTMHTVAPAMEDAVDIPLLHIADPTATAIKARGISTIALLGTRFTMEQDFYVGRLRKKHGLNVLLPNEEDRNEIHRIIYEELVHGTIRQESRATYLAIIERLKKQGANGIILGCTEISLLISSETLSLPCFDTTYLHAQAAVAASLGSPPNAI